MKFCGAFSSFGSRYKLAITVNETFSIRFEPTATNRKRQQIYSRTHLGKGPDQLPSISHSMPGGPINLYPHAQLKTARPP